MIVLCSVIGVLLALSRIPLSDPSTELYLTYIGNGRIDMESIELA